MQNKSRIYLGAIGAVCLLIVIMIIARIVGGGRSEVPSETAPPETKVIRETVIREVEVEKIVEVEKKITVGMVEEGLHDMGVLITGEYYFTDAVSFSKVRTLFNLIELGFTESSYLATYDGVVTAGLDFADISAVINEDLKRVTVTMPHAQIRNIDIDPASFVLYSEKTGIGNPLHASEFNASIVELEEAVRTRSVENGLLDRADENAQKLVENFIRGMIDDEEYIVEFVYR